MDTQSYEASASYPGRPSGAPGRIVMMRDYLRFHGDEEVTVILPLEGLCIQPGRCRKEVAQFTHPGRGGYKVYSRDRDLLKHPAFRNRGDMAGQIAYLDQSRRPLWLAVIGAVFLVGVLAAGIALSEDRVVAALARQIPPEMETQMGEDAFHQLTSSRTLIEDKRSLEGLREISQPLITSLNEQLEQRHPFQLHILDDPTINAFALPSGDVVVFTGLLLRAESPEEVAGVLAHEFSHVTHQHSMRQILASLGLVNIFQALMGDMSGVSMMSGTSLLTLQSSQDFEREADAGAFDLLVESRINPEGLLSFFRRLREESPYELEPGEMLSLLSTHPPTVEREEMLMQRINLLDVETEFDDYKFNFKSFQRRIRNKAKTDG